MPGANPRSCEQRRQHALQIWQAGVDAVRSDQLVLERVVRDGHQLLIDNALIESEPIDLHSVRRIIVVGAGKAGAGMAAGLEQALGEQLLAEKQVIGWVNVPADCVRPLKCIHLHPARPAGLNEPTEEGVLGSQGILRLVSEASPADLCICLFSGGGSALLPAPVDGISLDDKIQLTRWLSSAGADIRQLNAVRTPLSRIKGGGLAKACRAGRLISLIISDVLGDPIDVIASGPAVLESSEGVTASAERALAILRQFDPTGNRVPKSVLACLEQLSRNQHNTATATPERLPVIQNIILGNNAVAVDAAGTMAEKLGYSHAMESAAHGEGSAEEVGRRLATIGALMLKTPGPDCLISGGEPTVTLVDSAQRGIGGRNQQLALAALLQLAEQGTSGVTLLSGGTDGEDGPTDAAGALVDEFVTQAAASAGLPPQEFLARNDAYRFFEPLGALLKTGPTHTNVCDLRVVLVERREF